jgi:hypothetical protein
MRRVIALSLLVSLAPVGCVPQAHFRQETIQVAPNQIRLKGWTEKGRLCVELELRPGDETFSLHSVHLVDARGTKTAPSEWKDTTPQAPDLRVGFGVGFPIGGGHGDHHPAPHGDEGGGTRVVPGTGVSFPLSGGGKDGRTTAVRACWDLTETTRNVTACTLEVNLASSRRDRIEVTTVILAMAHPEDDDSPEHQPREDEPTARDLVREIDFTLKSPPETRVLEL